MDSEEADSGADSNPPLEGDSAALSQFIENMGLYFEDYGVPRIGGRMLGLMLVSSRPVTPEEMSEVLQVSRSSVSTNLRTLLMTGLADRVSLPGERSDHYEFSDDAWEKSLDMRLEGILSLQEMAEEGLQGMEDDHPARKRMLEILAWSDLVRTSYEQLITEWQTQRETLA